jgi:hypothetical protein
VVESTRRCSRGAVRAEGERFEEAATLLEGMLEIRADVRA